MEVKTQAALPPEQTSVARRVPPVLPAAVPLSLTSVTPITSPVQPLVLTPAASAQAAANVPTRPTRGRPLLNRGGNAGAAYFRDVAPTAPPGVGSAVRSYAATALLGPNQSPVVITAQAPAVLAPASSLAPAPAVATAVAQRVVSLAPAVEQQALGQSESLDQLEKRLARLGNVLAAAGDASGTKGGFGGRNKGRRADDPPPIELPGFNVPYIPTDMADHALRRYGVRVVPTQSGPIGPFIHSAAPRSDFCQRWVRTQMVAQPGDLQFGSRTIEGTSHAIATVTRHLDNEWDQLTSMKAFVIPELAFPGVTWNMAWSYDWLQHTTPEDVAEVVLRTRGGLVAAHYLFTNASGKLWGGEGWYETVDTDRVRYTTSSTTVVDEVDSCTWVRDAYRPMRTRSGIHGTLQWRVLGRVGDLYITHFWWLDRTLPPILRGTDVPALLAIGQDAMVDLSSVRKYILSSGQITETTVMLDMDDAYVGTIAGCLFAVRTGTSTKWFVDKSLVYEVAGWCSSRAKEELSWKATHNYFRDKVRSSSSRPEETNFAAELAIMLGYVLNMRRSIAAAATIVYPASYWFATFNSVMSLKALGPFGLFRYLLWLWGIVVGSMFAFNLWSVAALSATYGPYLQPVQDGVSLALELTLQLVPWKTLALIALPLLCAPILVTWLWPSYRFHRSRADHQYHGCAARLWWRITELWWRMLAFLYAFAGHEPPDPYARLDEFIGPGMLRRIKPARTIGIPPMRMGVGEHEEAEMEPRLFHRSEERSWDYPTIITKYSLANNSGAVATAFSNMPRGDLHEAREIANISGVFNECTVRRPVPPAKSLDVCLLKLARREYDSKTHVDLDHVRALEPINPDVQNIRLTPFHTACDSGCPVAPTVCEASTYVAFFERTCAPRPDLDDTTVQSFIRLSDAMTLTDDCKLADRDGLRPMPFNVWNARFSSGMQAVNKRAWEAHDDVRSSTKVFVKHELFTAGDNRRDGISAPEFKRGRIICPMDPSLTVHTGPMSAAIGDRMVNQWNGRGFPVYGGRSSVELGEIMTEYLEWGATEGLTPLFFNIDSKDFDGSTQRPIHNCIFTQDERLGRNVNFVTGTMVMRSTLPMHASIAETGPTAAKPPAKHPVHTNDTVLSGVPWTAIFDSRVSAGKTAGGVELAAIALAFRLGCPPGFIFNLHRHARAFVMGDDVLGVLMVPAVWATPEGMKILKSCLECFALGMGYTDEVEVFLHLPMASFCSARFIRALNAATGKEVWVLTPHIGRALSRFGWFVDADSRYLPAAMKGDCISRMFQFQHVEAIKRYFGRVLQSLEESYPKHSPVQYHKHHELRWLLGARSVPLVQSLSTLEDIAIAYPCLDNMGLNNLMNEMADQPVNHVYYSLVVAECCAIDECAKSGPFY